MSEVQEGVVYAHESNPRTSFSLVFLRAADGLEVSEVGDAALRIWSICRELKRRVNIRSLSGKDDTRNLTILIGYNSNVFGMQGIRKRKPTDFSDRWKFLSPSPRGGGPIVQGSGIRYADDIRDNHAEHDHIVLQFVARTEAATNQAIVETSRGLSDALGVNKSFSLSKFYTGFISPDQRNWLGFHDGVSNMKSGERLNAIAISNSKNRLNSWDDWTINGTYLAFLRAAIDLETWAKLSIRDQELILGRDKLTGCPLIGVDKGGKPVKDPRCPVPGTIDVTEEGNESFREHPPFTKQKNLPDGISDSTLTQSHIGRTRHITGTPVWEVESSRIFRQGFQFIEPIEAEPGFRVGLNFVSFQNSPLRFFNILQHWLGKANFGGDSERHLPGMDRFLTVRAAGLFFVPPNNKKETFPGASLFFTPDKARDFFLGKYYTDNKGY